MIVIMQSSDHSEQVQRAGNADTLKKYSYDDEPESVITISIINYYIFN
jgi:hypothetical protein